MRNPTAMYIIRGIMAALLGALGFVQLTSGHAVIGVLLIALAVMNVVMTLTMRRRRAQLLERFPGLANAQPGQFRGQGRGQWRQGQGRPGQGPQGQGRQGQGHAMGMGVGNSSAMTPPPAGGATGTNGSPTPR